MPRYRDKTGQAVSYWLRLWELLKDAILHGLYTDSDGNLLCEAKRGVSEVSKPNEFDDLDLQDAFWIPF